MRTIGFTQLPFKFISKLKRIDVSRWWFLFYRFSDVVTMCLLSTDHNGKTIIQNLHRIRREWASDMGLDVACHCWINKFSSYYYYLLLVAKWRWCYAVSFHNTNNEYQIAHWLLLYYYYFCISFCFGLSHDKQNIYVFIHIVFVVFALAFPNLFIIYYYHYDYCSFY